jgi:hypothetical protein
MGSTMKVVGYVGPGAVAADMPVPEPGRAVFKYGMTPETAFWPVAPYEATALWWRR